MRIFQVCDDLYCHKCNKELNGIKYLRTISCDSCFENEDYCCKTCLPGHFGKEGVKEWALDALFKCNHKDNDRRIINDNEVVVIRKSDGLVIIDK